MGKDKGEGGKAGQNNDNSDNNNTIEGGGDIGEEEGGLDEEEEGEATGPGRRKRKRTAKGLGLQLGKDNGDSEIEAEDRDEEAGEKSRKSGRKKRAVNYSLMNSKRAAHYTAEALNTSNNGTDAPNLGEGGGSTEEENNNNSGEVEHSPYVDGIDDEDEDIYRGGTKSGRSVIPSDLSKLLEPNHEVGFHTEVSELLMARIRPYPPHSTLEGNSYNESYDVYDELCTKLEKEKTMYINEIKKKNNYWQSLIEYQKEMGLIAMDMAQIREANSQSNSKENQENKDSQATGITSNNNISNARSVANNNTNIGNKNVRVDSAFGTGKAVGTGASTGTSTSMDKDKK